MRPCRICPTCKRAVALQANGTFYQHRDRNSGVQDNGHRRLCAWSGLQPRDGDDPMPEPRATVQQLRSVEAELRKTIEYMRELNSDLLNRNGRLEQERNAAREQLAAANERVAELETEREADTRAVRGLMQAAEGYEEGRALNRLLSRFYGRVMELDAADAKQAAREERGGQ